MNLPRAVPVVEVGGSHISATMVDIGTGEVELAGACRLPLAPDVDAGTFVATVKQCAAHLPATPGQVWGVALPGPFDYAHGIALYGGVGKFDALYGMDMGAALREALPGPPGQVVFLNDAHAFLLGEWRFGAARGHSRCAGVTLGTGIGSAFMVDGVVERTGPRVPREGRMDLVKVQGQGLEQFVSTRALVTRYRQVSGQLVPGAVEVADRARQGDARAARVLREAFTVLGRALAPWLDAFAADVVVAGGSMTGSWDLIGPAVAQGLAEGLGQKPPPPLLTCNRGADAALLGAATFADQRCSVGNCQRSDARTNAAGGAIL